MEEKEDIADDEEIEESEEVDIDISEEIIEEEESSEEPMESEVDTEEQELSEDETDPQLLDDNLSDGETENIDDDILKQELLEFSEFDFELSDDELLDLEEAISENIEELALEEEIEEEQEFIPEIDEELEKKLQAELAQKDKKKEAVVTKEDFIKKLSERRNKIIYHALWYLLFNMEDHNASKKALYEALKEPTSKDAVEPLAEHKFYFGLGFILRLEIEGKKVVVFSEGKLAINKEMNVEFLQNILEMIGDPISELPIITEKEKQNMFKEFLSDDFLDSF